MTSFLPSGVIALFCRQYDIIKDNEPNNNKEKAKNTSENSTPEHQSGGLLRSKVRRRVGRGGQKQGGRHFPVEPLETSCSVIILHRKRGKAMRGLQPEVAGVPKHPEAFPAGILSRTQYLLWPYEELPAHQRDLLFPFSILLCGLFCMRERLHKS